MDYSKVQEPVCYGEKSRRRIIDWRKIFTKEQLEKAQSPEYQDSLVINKNKRGAFSCNITPDRKSIV